ncbi:hypothetical protein HMPREF3226_00976 [Prevotella corporis]|uniref:Uncharacterized protein n=1 Tax=Prevotella corporis TaxID=28128 RepID=A0A133QCU7_9BACT|nr:hypothetical protein HMPREF3226_00976 [Prevotella corporis]
MILTIIQISFYKSILWQRYNFMVRTGKINLRNINLNKENR